MSTHARDETSMYSPSPGAKDRPSRLLRMAERLASLPDPRTMHKPMHKRLCLVVFREQHLFALVTLALIRCRWCLDRAGAPFWGALQQLRGTCRSRQQPGFGIPRCLREPMAKVAADDPGVDVGCDRRL